MQTISCPQKSTNINVGKNLAILALCFDALMHAWTQSVTGWVQRNLSPTASLQLHVSHLKALIKEKTPHQKTGEALNLTFCEPELGVGGRTTPRTDQLTLHFALTGNIVARYKNIIATIAIIAFASTVTYNNTKTFGYHNREKNSDQNWY